MAEKKKPKLYTEQEKKDLAKQTGAGAVKKAADAFINRHKVLEVQMRDAGASVTPKKKSKKAYV